MAWLGSRLREGIFGTGWLNAGICLLLAAGVYFSSKVYTLLNHGPAVVFLKTPLDDFIPVVTPFVIPYVSLEPFVYASLVLFLLFRTRFFQSAALSLISAFWISFVFYFFLQSVVVRPLLPEQDLFTQMIRQVYSGDNPFNDFPSLHTSLSTILALHWRRLDARIGMIVTIWVALIVLSTVFIKQHYVPDLAAGLLLAFAVARLFLNKVAGTRLQNK